MPPHTDGSQGISGLTADLGIPTSSTTGKVTGDHSKWSIFTRFGISVPLANPGGGSSVGGKHHVDNSQGAVRHLEPSSAVADALAILAANARANDATPPALVVDDFHFVIDTAKRRELVLALRPIAESDLDWGLRAAVQRKRFRGDRVSRRRD